MQNPDSNKDWHTSIVHIARACVLFATAIAILPLTANWIYQEVPKQGSATVYSPQELDDITEYLATKLGGEFQTEDIFYLVDTTFADEDVQLLIMSGFDEAENYLEVHVWITPACIYYYWEEIDLSDYGMHFGDLDLDDLWSDSTTY